MVTPTTAQTTTISVMMLTTSLLRRVSGVRGRNQDRRPPVAGPAGATAMGWVTCPAAGRRGRIENRGAVVPCGPVRWRA